MYNRIINQAEVLIMNSKEKYDYWVDLAQYDLVTSKAMFETKRYLYVAFMCQQSLEKLIKGLYVLYIEKEPPRTHNIWNVLKEVIRCDKLQPHIDIDFNNKINMYKPFFADLVYYYISERYPSYKQKAANILNELKAKEILENTKEVFTWLQSLSRYKQ